MYISLCMYIHMLVSSLPAAKAWRAVAAAADGALHVAAAAHTVSDSQGPQAAGGLLQPLQASPLALPA